MPAYPKPEIITFKSLHLVGINLTMSLSGDKTRNLFSKFMPVISRIYENPPLVYDVKVYPPSFFSPFDPLKSYTKWALVEKNTGKSYPSEFENFSLPDGLYALFQNLRTMGDPAIFNHIFTAWLPNSKYTLDERPHFDVMMYDNDRTILSEKIYIPIKT